MSGNLLDPEARPETNPGAKMTRSCLTIILAAGEGTRMKSSTPKVLHEVAGLAMVGHVLNTARQAGGTGGVVVIGAGAEKVQGEIAAIDRDAGVAVQRERMGTAHAVLAAEKALESDFDDVLVLCGDVPLIQSQTLLDMRTKLHEGADIVVLGFDTQDPTGYGRLLVEDGQLVAIREHKDASVEEKKVTLCNSGIMAFRGAIALETLRAIRNDNSQGEYYLTDAVEVGRSKGLAVIAMQVDEEETLGVNNRVQLAEVEAIWQNRKRQKMMLDGVTLTAPATVIFSHDTAIGPDSVIEPHVVFASGVKIDTNVTVHAFSHLEGTTIASNAIVGPYARLRPGAELREASKVGNFCEVKKSVIGEGAKVNHLTYIGDASIGAGTNIGAGTVTCNYDGINKHHTEIGRDVFVGTNSSLVAPLTIGDGANIAAGSVITKNVPANALGIGRGKHVNLDDYAKKIRGRNAALKRSAKKKS